jgi:hypothetical protein
MKYTDFFYEFQPTVYATVCCCITADQTLSLAFIVGGSVNPQKFLWNLF